MTMDFLNFKLYCLEFELWAVSFGFQLKNWVRLKKLEKVSGFLSKKKIVPVLDMGWIEKKIM